MPYTIKHYLNKSQIVPQFEIALKIEVWTLNFNNFYKYQFLSSSLDIFFHKNQNHFKLSKYLF